MMKHRHCLSYFGFKSILVILAITCILLITYAKYHTIRRSINQMPHRLGRLKNAGETLKTTLHTYLGRITQFLMQHNISNSWYESTTSTQLDFKAAVEHAIRDLQQLERQQLLNMSQGTQLRNGCQKSCCWTAIRIPSYYHGEKNRFPNVLDRLSQIDFKLLADVHFGGLPVPHGIILPKLTEDILPCLQNTTTIFVDTVNLGHFFRDLHPKISVHYILITGDSDLPCPLHIMSAYRTLLDEIFSGKTRIVKWFAMNCNVGNNEKWQKSHIFTCLPQGISQWMNQRYYMQLASGKADAVHNVNLKTEEYWMLTSFNTDTNPQERLYPWYLTCYGRLRDITRCFYQRNTSNQWMYYLHTARSRFVLSPPGKGLDCYRTWEALYLGSIPIVKTTSINSIFEQLPVLSVRSFSDITLKLLQDTYFNMTRQTYDYKRLYKGYWQQQINAFRNPSESIHIRYTRRNE